MANSVARAYNRGLGTEPQRGAGAEHLVKGLRSPEAEALTFNLSRKFAHFSKIWKRKEIRYLCCLCKKSSVSTKVGEADARA